MTDPNTNRYELHFDAYIKYRIKSDNVSSPTYIQLNKIYTM